MSMKKVVFSSLILLTIITLYITKNNTNKISELIDNNMLAFTIDGENSSFMPKKSSGYKVKSITCKNNSNVVWDNDNWEIEVIKLESEDTCVIDFTTETNFEYAYTGNVQTFTAPTSGEYTLEVWGAQGGYANETYTGGYGGYSTGTINLDKDETLYIYVGGTGESNCNTTNCAGGYNGGGQGGAFSDNINYVAGGGCATHISKTNALLKDLSDKKGTYSDSTKTYDSTDIIIVAGGGEAGYYHTNGADFSSNGGSGGGYLGNDGATVGNYNNPGGGGSQTAGGAKGTRGDTKSGFGYGGSGTYGSSNDSTVSSGGGGGFFGGGTSAHSSPGGGSGFIGNPNLTNKVMYCYNCKSSDEEQIKTVSTTSTSETPTSNYAKIGNGYAKITKSIESVASSVKVITNEPEALDSTNKTTVENGTIIFYMDENSKLISGSRCTYKVEDNKIIINNVNQKITCNFNFSVGKTLYAKILADKTTRPGERSNFSVVVTSDNTKTLYTGTEDNKTVYYFAGNALDNWVKFGGFYWRIIRTNADGSIRLLYNGTNTTVTDAYIGTSAFNSVSTDPMYVGYKYGTSGTLASNRTNTNNSTIKGIIDTWYETNLNSYTTYLSNDAVYCNDRSITSGSYSLNAAFDYSAATRLQTNKAPTYNCADTNDAFSVNNTNAKLDYPIGLMTADEVAFAGGVHMSSDSTTTYYYYNSANGSSTGTYNWYLMTPWSVSYNKINSDSYVFFVGGSSLPGKLLSGNATASYASHVVRPVISLKGNNKWKSGDGSASNPYEIVTE